MPQKISKYEIIERIGRGGMGTVYKAMDPSLKRFVAVKVISRNIDLTDEMRIRFFEEASACGRLSHPNIVTIFDVGEEEDHLFIVMEFLEGSELKRLIEDQVRLTLDENLQIMIQLCDAMSLAHSQGIVHRDLKPGNIFCQKSGPVKIIDFGIAKAATSSSLTRTGLIMGTLRYMAPEQVRGRADQRSDQFSLAAVFYEMLSRRPPHVVEDVVQLLEEICSKDPPDLLELVPTIPADLARIIHRGMSRDADKRFPDLRAMRGELEGVRRRLQEEARRDREEIDALKIRVLELDTALQQKLGGRAPGSATEEPEQGADPDVLEKFAQNLRSRLGGLQEQAGRVDALAPAFERGLGHLHAERFEDAHKEFAELVESIPGWVSAQQRLEEAKAGEERIRIRDLVDKLIDEARRALRENDGERSLRILQQVADLPAAGELAAQVADLRRAAKALLAEQDASRRVQQQAERAKDGLLEARRAADHDGAPTQAFDSWTRACELEAAADRATGEKRFSDAFLGYEQASMAFRKAGDEVRDALLRKQRDEESRRREEDAEERRQFTSRVLGEARTALDQGEPDRCVEILKKSAALLPSDETRQEIDALIRAADSARSGGHRAAPVMDRDTRERARAWAERARSSLNEVLRSVEEHQAMHRAPGVWTQVQAKVSQAQSAYEREDYTGAFDAFEAGIVLCERYEDEFRAASVAGRRSAGAAAAGGTTSGGSEVSPPPTASVEPRPAAEIAPSRTGAATTSAASPSPAGDGGENTVMMAAHSLAMDATIEASSMGFVEEVRSTSRGASAPSVVTRNIEGARKISWDDIKLTMLAAAAAVAVVVALLFNLRPEPRGNETGGQLPSPIDSEPGTAPQAPPAVGSVSQRTEVRVGAPAAQGTVAPANLEPEAEKAPDANSPAHELDAGLQHTAEVARERSNAAKAVAQNENAARYATEQFVVAKAAEDGAASVFANAGYASAARLYDDARAAFEIAATQARTRAAAEASETADAALREQVASKADAEAKARTEARAKADREAKAKADADAKAAAHTKLEAATKKKEADDARQLARLSGADSASTADAAAKPLLATAYAVVFTEPTNGSRGGGAWGVCWRSSADAARACAQDSCTRTRTSTQVCVEAASTQPGGHCAVARASGYGVTMASCAGGREAAEGEAIAKCAQQVGRYYGGVGPVCRIVWSAVKP